MLDPCDNCILCKRAAAALAYVSLSHMNMLGRTFFLYDHPEWNPGKTIFCEEDDNPCWKVISETWEGKGKETDQQLRNDAVLWYRTIFPMESHLLEKWRAENQKPVYHRYMKEFFPKQQGLFIRLFLALADGLVAVDGRDQKQRWDQLPIVAALSHGDRIHFKINRNELTEPYQFFRWLTGVVHPVFALTLKRNPPTMGYLFDRWTSSHGIEWKVEPPNHKRFKKQYSRMIHKAKKGMPLEIKKLLGDTTNQVAANIPFGGLGSPTPREGEIVGPNGIPLDTIKKRFQRALLRKQHGHMLLRAEDGEEWGSLLVGLESCEAGTTNHFGKGHGIKNAFKAGDRAVSGGVKLEKIRNAAYKITREPHKIKYKKQYKRIAQKKGMPQLKDLAPRKYDGMIVHIDQKRYDRLQRLYKAIDDCCEYRQRQLFRKLFPCTQPQAQETLAMYFPLAFFGYKTDKEDLNIRRCVYLRRVGIADIPARDLDGIDIQGI